MTGARTLVVLSICEGKELTVYLIRLLTMMKACPQVDTPARAPSCRLVTFLDEGLLAGFSEISEISESSEFSEVTPRIESDEVTLVTMTGVFVLPVIIPLVQVTFLADSIRMELPQGGLLGCDIIVAERTCGDDIPQQLTDDGKVGSTSITGHTMIALVCDILILR